MSESTKSLKQENLDEIAKTLKIIYKVEDNISGGRALFSASITLHNKCSVELAYAPYGPQWGIFFSHLRMVEPSYLPSEDSVDLEYAGVKISHLNGCIFRISPLKSFASLSKDESLKIKFNGQHYSASRSDILPNWYIHLDGLEPRVVQSTASESLDFVESFETPKQYKRYDYIGPSGKRRYDVYQPFTAEVRFSRYHDVSSKVQVIPVIPTPVKSSIRTEQVVNINDGQWTIVTCEAFYKEAEFLAGKLSLPVKKSGENDFNEDDGKAIVLKQLPSTDDLYLKTEGYKLCVDASKNICEISSGNCAGIFYGVQTLLSLLSPYKDKPDGSIVDIYIEDYPRYCYRGMHADVSRNFQRVEEIKRLLDEMARYKLNTFHFHLTDDEGWRLEIPGLPELTEIGSKRGHDPSEDNSLLPFFGSGPFASGLGCGFYSVKEYQDILQYANSRHIEVIPEIDMPGHSHAAVRSMQVRYNRFMEQDNKKEADRYLLSDPSEPASQAYSVQMLTDNSLNPGVDSTYHFVDKVIKELIEMHKDIQPLRVFHLGGDEVPLEAWDNSPACLKLRKSEKTDELMEYFVTRVARLVHEHGLELGVWQDGIVEKHSGPYKRSKFPNKQVLCHFWRNVWESGQAFDAFKLANNDFKVVLAPGTHLYFDHPHEPDPEERGLYWACRYIDTQKVFGFAPDSLMSNADVKLTGEKLSKTDIGALNNSEDFTQLKKPENIIGIQGQIWTELVRTPQQFHEMIFPRLLALAERAWHKAAWEDLQQEERKAGVEEAWRAFSQTLGLKELQRLEKNGVPFHIPPPGARITASGKLELRCCYPGLPMSFSLDNGQTWTEYTGHTDVTSGESILARVSSPSAKSHSREVKINTNTDHDVKS